MPYYSIPKHSKPIIADVIDTRGGTLLFVPFSKTSKERKTTGIKGGRASNTIDKNENQR